MKTERLPMYEMSISALVSLQAQSLSNVGSKGSNRMAPRRQLLANGVLTDAFSGNIAKRYNAMLLAEQLSESGVVLCPACAARDGRRAAALMEKGKNNLSIANILACGLCDIHGFLVTAKKNLNGNQGEDRQRISKHSLIEFSFALASPEQKAEPRQLFTRQGDETGEGQMIYSYNGRSGHYAFCVRYKSVGIGVDTDRWATIIDDDEERLIRHQAILHALHDQLLSGLLAK